MEKEIAAALEDITAYREEQQIFLETAKKINVLQSQESDNKIEHNTEIDRLRKIVGDYHPGPSSKTYKELLQDNQRLQKDIAVQTEKIEALKKESQTFLARIALQEKEIAHLRKSFSVPTKKALTESEPKKKGMFSKHKSGKAHTPHSSYSEEEKLERLRLLIMSHYFSDEQVRFLSESLIQKAGLDADHLLRLADPRLSVDRMKILYKLFCSQCGVDPILLEDDANENSASDTPIQNTSSDGETNSNTQADGESSVHPLAIDVKLPQTADTFTSRLTKLSTSINTPTEGGRRK